MYNRVPTNDTELPEIRDAVDRGLSYDEFNRFIITPFIIGQCIIQLKTGKYDGSEGFNSNHLINGGHRLHVFLFVLFNCIIVHGHTHRDILVSTIIFIPRDLRASLCKMIIIEAFLCLMLFVSCLIMLLCIYVTTFYIHLTGNLDVFKIIPHICAV